MKWLPVCLALAAPVSAESFVVTDGSGQRDVNGSAMTDAVRACWTAFDPAGSDRIDCIGDAAHACMDEDIEWGGTTLGMALCLRAEHAVWDKIVAEEFEALIAVWAERDASDAGHPDNGRPLREDALRAGQTAWERYRETDCTVESSRWRGGTGAAILSNACWMNRTARRAVRLALLRTGK